jgi:hypothetical protein
MAQFFGSPRASKICILLANKKIDKNCSTIYSMHFETTKAYLQKVAMYSGYLPRT